MTDEKKPTWVLPEGVSAELVPGVGGAGGGACGKNLRTAEATRVNGAEALEDAPKEPRECWCEHCDRAYPVWVAPSILWNAVVRAPADAAGEVEPFLCPTCFAMLAESRGVVPTAWVLAPETPEMFEFLCRRPTEGPQPEVPLRTADPAVESGQTLAVVAVGEVPRA